VSAPWKAAIPVPSPTEPDLLSMTSEAHAVLRSYLSLIDLAAATSPRSKQIPIGASEIGWDCDRRLAYRLAGTAPVNYGDPMKLIVGIGVHLWLAERFRALDGGSGRFLVEYDCLYGDVPGHGDLYDRHNHVALDWKTTSRSRIKEMARRGEPSRQYVTQINHNALGLKAMGEQPKAVALIFLARDGGLDDSWAWMSRLDPSFVDSAVERLRQIESVGHIDPAAVSCTPGKDCGFCRNYNPTSTNLSLSCDARKGR